MSEAVWLLSAILVLLLSGCGEACEPALVTEIRPNTWFFHGKTGFIEVTWDYQSACKPVGYLVSVHHSDNQSWRTTVMTNYFLRQIPDICHPIKVVIAAFTEGNVGPETHANFHFSQVPAPLPPVLSSIKQLDDEKKWIIDWLDHSKCPVSQYNVRVYDQLDRTVYQLTTNQTKIELSGPDFCEKLFIDVEGSSIHGQSGKWQKKPLSNPPGPIPPSNLSVLLNQTLGQFVVQWTDESVCPATEYEVQFIAKGLSGSIKAGKPPIVLAQLPSCQPITIQAGGKNKFGVSGLSEARTIILPNNTYAPSKLHIEIINLLSFIVANWSATGACEGIEFLVTLYAENHTVIKQLVTTTTSVHFTGLSTCTPMILGVQIRSEIWTSDEVRSDFFKLPAAPAQPKDITLRMNKNQTKVLVSWLSDGGPCGPNKYIVTLYKGSNIVQEAETRELNVTFEVIKCTTGCTIGIVVENQFAKSTELYSEKFLATEIVEAPLAPSKVHIDVSPDKNRVTASWVHDGATNYTVSLYKENNKLAIQRTTKMNITLDRLPAAVPLQFGVIAHSIVGDSTETLSTTFRVPSAQESSTGGTSSGGLKKWQKNHAIFSKTLP